jgi:nitroimidazol reductase NimA-like FMN-containing flavoprotein (pyridoxamine 5'-phosphate oxidase superfamily)
MTDLTIRNLTKREIEPLLRRHNVGHIAFTDGRRVDIEPIGYVYDDGAIYGRAAPGTRVKALSGRPWVAFEIDDIRGPFDWESVVVKGTVYVVEPGPSQPMREHYEKALRIIRSQMPDALTDRDPAPDRTILFRLQIDEMEGRCAEPASRPAGGRPGVRPEPLGST